MTQLIRKMICGRNIKTEVPIKAGSMAKDVPFLAWHKAEEFLKLNGFKFGSLDQDNPVGFMLGEYRLPQKWHNLDKDDKFKLNGILISDDFRHGDIKIIFFE